MNMKMIGVTEDMHIQLKKISKATGIIQYRLIQEVLDILEERYKEKIQKYNEMNHE